MKLLDLLQQQLGSGLIQRAVRLKLEDLSDKDLNFLAAFLVVFFCLHFDGLTPPGVAVVVAKEPCG